MPSRQKIYGGSTRNLPVEFGHAIGMIAHVGLEEVGGGDPKQQLKFMQQKAVDEVIKYGPKILDFMQPELRVLIEQDSEMKELLKNAPK